MKNRAFTLDELNIFHQKIEKYYSDYYNLKNEYFNDEPRFFVKCTFEFFPEYILVSRHFKDGKRSIKSYNEIDIQSIIDSKE